MPCSTQACPGGRQCCVWHDVKNTYLSCYKVFKRYLTWLLMLIFHNSIVLSSIQAASHQCFQLQGKHVICTVMYWTTHSLVNNIKKTFYGMLELNYKLSQLGNENMFCCGCVLCCAAPATLSCSHVSAGAGMSRALVCVTELSALNLHVS